jgi:hypothetical protein
MLKLPEMSPGDAVVGARWLRSRNLRQLYVVKGPKVYVDWTLILR